MMVSRNLKGSGDPDQIIFMLYSSCLVNQGASVVARDKVLELMLLLIVDIVV